MNFLTKLLACLIIVVGLNTITSCRKTALDQPEVLVATSDKQPQFQHSGRAHEGRRVYINNVDQLYMAINDPSNVGSMLVLAPGTYLLKPNYPKAGRLELQHNMSLIGKSGNVHAVVIDVSGLPAASYVIPPTPTYPSQLRTGPIRIGNGYNAVEWITFTNNPANILRSMIQTDIVAKQNVSDPAPLAQVRVAHTIIKNSSIGLNILNRDPSANGRVLEAEVEYNEIFNNTQPQFGSGVQIQNSQSVTGALITVNLKGNHFHGNRQGLNMFNSSSKGYNKIIARSISDRLEKNGLGLVLTAGLNSIEGTSQIVGNTVDFEANATSIRYNGGSPAPLSNYIAGGIFISGGNVGRLASSTGAPGTVISNSVEAIFKGCRIEDNLGNADINVFGAYSSLSSPLPAGINNSSVLVLLGVSKQAIVNAVASFPVEPAGTNTVTVQR